MDLNRGPVRNFAACRIWIRKNFSGSASDSGSEPRNGYDHMVPHHQLPTADTHTEPDNDDIWVHSLVIGLPIGLYLGCNSLVRVKEPQKN
jgi:hypothetical protein